MKMKKIMCFLIFFLPVGKVAATFNNIKLEIVGLKVNGKDYNSNSDNKLVALSYLKKYEQKDLAGI